jgi:hypothetical protein
LDTGPLLFSEEELPWRLAYDPDAVRKRLEDMLTKMRAAASWPWKSATVEFYRESLWPSLLSKLEHGDARHLRSRIDAEIARLEAAA